MLRKDLAKYDSCFFDKKQESILHCRSSEQLLFCTFQLNVGKEEQRWYASPDSDAGSGSDAVVLGSDMVSGSGVVTDSDDRPAGPPPETMSGLTPLKA